MKVAKYLVCLWGMLLLISATVPRIDAAENRTLSSSSYNPRTDDYTTYIDANKILMVVGNTGGFARDEDGVFGYDYGTFFPYISTDYIVGGLMYQSPLYAAGLYVGGKVNGQTRVTVAQYAQEYGPGPIIGGTFAPDDTSYHVYKLYRDSLEDNPNSAYLSWPAAQGAPVDAEGRPVMFGDQMTWCVFNDGDPSRHTVSSGGTAPLGIEVRQTVWASDQSGTDTIPGPTYIPITKVGSSRIGAAIEVMDREQMTGHEYRIVIDTLSALQAVWSLEDITAGSTLLSGQTNFSGDETSPIVDGVRVRVYGQQSVGRLADWQWTGSERPLTGYNWGGSGFFGGIGALGEFFQSDLTVDDLRYVEIRWVGDGNGQKAYLYNRSNGYSYEGFFPQDFEVWDVTPGYPKGQINFSIVESDWPAPHTPPDSIWNPGVQLSNVADPYSWDFLGGREYFQIMTSDYSDTPLPAYEVDGWFNGSAPAPQQWDILYGGWLRYWADDGKPDSGDVFLLIPEDPTIVPDTFNFVSTPPPIIATGPEGVSVYIAYKLYNKGANTIDDCYVGLWLDPDLGGAADDFVGCDSLTNTFYCYNASNEDSFYGDRPPAIGFKVLYGPLVRSIGDTAVFEGERIPNSRNLGLHSFVKYINGTDPDNYLQTYANMQGLYTSGSPYVYNGDTTTFWLSGDPVLGIGDIDSDPRDRRMMGSCGPFTFYPGDSQYVLIKMAVGPGTDRLSSITKMRQILNMPFDFPTGVEDETGPELPKVFTLEQNYPNPFNPVTNIEYSLPMKAHVEIDIFNILGQKVTTLVDEYLPAGIHTTVWDGTASSGQRVSTGIYFYRIRAGSFVESKKMLLLK